MADLVDLLKEYGSDFQIIALRMGRTREQIKRKYKILERRYPRLAEAIFEEGDGKTRKDWTPCLTLGEI